MKISIIVATYNSGSTVKDTLQSIIAQSYDDWEVIVQDGGSTDETLDIARSYQDDRIRIYEERDSGLYDAMNRGIAKCNGEIIGILNSDDVYAHDGVLKQIADSFYGRTELDVVYANLEYVDQSLSKVLRYWKCQPYKRSLFLSAWQPPHPTVYVRRRLYDHVGDFDTRFKIAADFDLMFRVFFVHKMVSHYIDDTFVKMRIGGISNSSIGNRLFTFKEYRLIYGKHGHWLIGPFAIGIRILSRLSQYK